MSTIVCLVALVTGSFSCKKSTDPGTTPSTEKVKVYLYPGGEFTINQTPLSDARLTGGIFARSGRDSTYYAVDIFADSSRYAIGIFDNLDSISVMLDPTLTYNIKYTMVKRGTGPGLYWEASSKQTLFSPIAGVVKNKMDYSPDIPPNTSGFNNYFDTFKSDTSSQRSSNHIGEVTTFYGVKSGYTINKSDPNITIPLRRIVFGIKYSCDQLVQGKLVVRYIVKDSTSIFPGKIFTPVTIENSLSIYSCDQFVSLDSITSVDPLYALYADINWELADGRKYNLGKHKLPLPHRNHVLNVNLTLPAPDSSISIITLPNNSALHLQYSETEFTNNTSISF